MPEPQSPWKTEERQGFTLFCMLVAGHATTIAPIFRSGQGAEAFGYRGLLGALILVLTFGLGGDPMIGGYFLFWLAVLFFRRVEGMRLERQGLRTHSRYDGWPVLCDWFGVNEVTGRGMEAGLCAAVAMALDMAAEAYRVPWQGLAVYIGLGAVSIPVDYGVRRAIGIRRLRQMRDAKIEQENLMERFRQWEGE